MRERQKTACWVRRFGAAALAILALLFMGGLSTRESALETAPPAKPNPAASPETRYGPNPKYRFSPQINRIIRLAQRDDEKKKRATGGDSGGTQLKQTTPTIKSAPLKKETAPVTKKKTTTPETKKKVAPAPKKTAPVVKKKDTAPARKKEVAPVKKKEAPVVKKKEIAPVKKETAPVVKKKEEPAVKKETVAPVKKETVPALKKETAPAETTGPSEQQLLENKEFCAQNPTSPKCVAEQPEPVGGPSQQEQENIEFCAKNPNDPSCSKEAPPPEGTEAAEPEPATEKICAANPKYPGCDKFGQQPSLGPAPEDAGKVGGICEQNPQLPQCQGTQETTQPGLPGGRPEEEEAVEGPPGAPGTDVGGGPPGFIPPGAPAPVPPGPPPSPPPVPTGDETPPPGPTIQTVQECPEGQVLFAGNCVYPGICPEGQVEYTDFTTDPPQHGLCGDACPEGQVERLGSCIGEFPCFNEGGTTYNMEQCVEQCPEAALTYNGRCFDQCPAASHQEGDECVPGCPEGQFPGVGGVCVPNQCAEGEYRAADSQCVTECPEGTTPNSGAEIGAVPHCQPQCTEGEFVQVAECVQQCSEAMGYNIIVDGRCLRACPPHLIEHAGTCWSTCPSGTITHNQQCLTECPEGTGLFAGQCHTVYECPSGQVSIQGDEPFERECVDSCPEGAVEFLGRCVGTAVCGSYGGAVHEGQCVDTCPEGSVALAGGGCAPQCLSGEVAIDGQCTSCGENQLGGQCDACPTGHVVNGECSACEIGQIPVEGACRPVEEAGYDEFIEYCQEGLSSGASGQYGSNLGFDYSGQSPQRQCELFVELGCNSESLFADIAACADRPPLCGEGEIVATDGSCTTSCGEGQFVLNDFQCTSSCLGGQVVFGTECRDGGCPQGYATEGNHEEGYQCVADCPPGQSRGADGQCSNPCPDGQQFMGDTCRNICPEGEAFAGDSGTQGPCRPQCPGTLTPVNGVCVDPEMISYDDAMAACENSDPHFVLFEGRHEPSACAQYIADRCDDPNQTGNNEARYCAEMPAPGETVVAEGLTDGEAPPDDAAPPPDGEAPPENHVGAPPDGEAPPTNGCATFTTQEGECVDQCPSGQVGQGGLCVAELPDGASPPEDETPVTDQPPHSGCPEGTYVLENVQNGGCMPHCPEGTVGNDYGYCVAEVPEDQAPPPPPPVTDGVPPVTGGPPAAGEPTATAPSAPVIGKPEAPPIVVAKPAPGTATGGPAPVKKPRGKPIAVVIGIGDYANGDISDTPQAIDNAAHVVRFLKDDLGFADDRIITGRNATLADFHGIFGKTADAAGKLRDLVRKENPSEVIVYVSGRALAANGGKDLLLLPADADPAKPATGVRLSALYNALAAMGVPRLRLYLDPSFVKGDEVVKLQAGPVIGPAGILTPRSWVTLSAASDSAVFADDPKRPRTLFTESLITGLRGLADTTGDGDTDGTVSAEELHLFARDQAEAMAKRGGKQPVPSLFGPPEEPLRTY